MNFTTTEKALLAVPTPGVVRYMAQWEPDPGVVQDFNVCVKAYAIN